MKKCICILGRTGSGKSSLVKEVSDDLNIPVVASYTTRQPRINETNYSDHIFISDKEADSMLKNDDVVAYTEINNFRYFVTLQQLREHDLCLYTIDPQGFDGLVATLNNWNVTDIELAPIYISAPKLVRMERYLTRDNCTQEDFEKRNNSENAQFNNFEIKIIRHSDNRLGATNTVSARVIKNTSSFEDAVRQMREIIK